MINSFSLAGLNCFFSLVVTGLFWLFISYTSLVFFSTDHGVLFCLWVYCEESVFKAISSSYTTNHLFENTLYYLTLGIFQDSRSLNLCRSPLIRKTRLDFIWFLILSIRLKVP